MGCSLPPSRPQHTPSAVAAKAAALRAMRCSCSRSRANGTASGIAAALVSMQAARLSPGRTRHAAEPTAGPNAAATSADTDGNGRVCVDGLGPYALPPPLLSLAAARPSKALSFTPRDSEKRSSPALEASVLASSAAIARSCSLCCAGTLAAREHEAIEALAAEKGNWANAST